MDLLALMPLDLLYLKFGTEHVVFRAPRLLKIQSFWEFFKLIDRVISSPHMVGIKRRDTRPIGDIDTIKSDQLYIHLTCFICILCRYESSRRSPICCIWFTWPLARTMHTVPIKVSQLVSLYCSFCARKRFITFSKLYPYYLFICI